jgi:hypothetical protein
MKRDRVWNLVALGNVVITYLKFYDFWDDFIADEQE